MLCSSQVIRANSWRGATITITAVVKIGCDRYRPKSGSESEKAGHRAAILQQEHAFTKESRTLPRQPMMVSDYSEQCSVLSDFLLPFLRN